MSPNTACEAVLDELDELVAGNPDAIARHSEHLAGCDDCRDARHEASQLVAVVGGAGNDYVPMADLESRILAKIDAEQFAKGSLPGSTSVGMGVAEIAAATKGGAIESKTIGSKQVESKVEAKPATATELMAATVKVDAKAGARVVDTVDAKNDMKAGARAVDKVVDAKAVDAKADVKADMNVDPKAIDAKAIDAKAVDTAADKRDAKSATDKAADKRDAKSATKSADAKAADAKAAEKRDAKSATDKRDAKVVDISSRRPARKLVAAAAFAAVAAAGVGFYAMSRKSSGTTTPDHAVVAKDGSIGKVEKLERAAKDGADGVTVNVNGQDRPLRAGEAIPAGATVKTDDRTRISLVMADGTKLVLDHQTAVAFAASEPRQMRVDAGRMVADVAHVEHRQASITTPNGRIDVVGTRFSVTATSSLTTVQVVRGAIVLNNQAGEKHEVRAGEEGTIENGKLEVSSAPNLGREVEWSELAKPAQSDTTSAGLGALRAYKPGEKRDRDWNLALASHDVKVRISGPVARTEITETFRNDTNNQLEGVYQFPLPADAQIDSLELDVKDGFMQGAFVDKERAAKIWRGVIDKATPKIAARPSEDIIWVQGPWRDPALLDWKRGGRFELRIFPIPAKGARTIKIAYTQVVKPRGAWRQYVYPLPHSADGSTVADKFSVDVEVRGGAQGRTRAQGYQLVADPNRMSVDAMTLSQSAFVPRGDLVIDYRADSDAEVRAWTFTGGAAVAPDEKLAAKKGVGNDPKVVEAQKAIAGDVRPTAVIALKPKLPRWDQAKPRDYMIVVDTSQSMAGERMTRAADLAASMVGEMDRRDQFSIMACDSECRRFDGGMRTPTNSAAEEAKKWLSEQTAAGASDVVAAIRAATTDFTRGTERERWVIYVGDGFATTGFRKSGDVERAIATTTGTDIRVTTVGIGTDADAALLGAAARGGGGSYLAWLPGQTVHAAAMASLESTYGSALRDAKIELPAGLADVAPTVLPTVRSGEEVLVAARVTGEVKGDVVVKGTVAGQPYEQRYPLTLAVSNAAGNGFVPRLWATLAIEQLERAGHGEDRARIVALSQGFGVMSKETSLLVLESKEMFDAFGVDRSQPSNKWTGEESLDETLASGTIDYADNQEIESKADAKASDRASASGKKAGTFAGLDAGGGDAPAPVPATSKPAAPAKDKANMNEKLAKREERRPPPPPMDPRGRAGMIAMRRSWVRVPSVGMFDAVSPNIRKAVDNAETALAANPDSREKHRALVQALSYAGETERARDVASRWLERDKLDPQALAYQADLLGRDGQRDLALRTLSGLVDLDADRVALHERMIKAYENAGRMVQACSHRIAISAIQRKDAKAAGAAMRCLRGVGRDKDAELVVRGLDTDEERTAAEKAATVAPASTSPRGDVVINARWSTNADVDVAIIAPDGSRTSWMGGALVEDSTSGNHETLAMRRIRRGNYLVEITRNGNASGAVRGSLDVSVLGSKKTIPFELVGSRATVGRITIALEQRLDRIWMDGTSCWLINATTGARSKTRCP